jgi:hypothetical protein
MWMAIYAVAAWLIVVTLGRRGGRTLWITAVVAFVLSCAAARLAEAVFRA